MIFSDVTRQLQTRISRRVNSSAAANLGWLLLLLAAGALLRLFMLTNQSLWFDEGISLVVTDSRDMALTYAELWSQAGGDKYQPVYFMLLSVWRILVGESEFALRMLSVIPGVVALAFMFGAAQRLFDRQHARWATLYMACSAFWICYSQEVRPYALLVMLASIQLYLLAPALQRSGNTFAASMLFAVVTAVSGFASVLLVFFTGALAIAHYVGLRNLRAWLSWWLPVLITCLPVLLYFLGTPAAEDPASDSTNGLGVPIYKNAVFSLYGLFVGHTYGPPLDVLRSGGDILSVARDYGWRLAALALVVVALMASLVVSIPALARSTEQRRRSNRFVAGLLVASIGMAVILADATKINWMPRHSFYISLPIALLLPLTFCGRQVALQKRLCQASQLVFLAIIAMNLFASYNYFYKSEYWRDDYRSAAGYLSNTLGGEDSSLLLWGETRLLSYYGDNATQDAWRSNPVRTLATKVADADDGNGNIFLAINREFTWSRQMSTDDPLESQLSDHYALVSVQKYVNFNIYEFTAKQQGVVVE